MPKYLNTDGAERDFVFGDCDVIFFYRETPFEINLYGIISKKIGVSNPGHPPAETFAFEITINYLLKKYIFH